MKKLARQSKAEATLDPLAKLQLQKLGLLLRARRVKRKLSRQQFGERVLIGDSTLRRMEKGDATVSIGYYLAAAGDLKIEMLSPQVDAADSLPADIARARGRSSKGDNWFPET